MKIRREKNSGRRLSVRTIKSPVGRTSFTIPVQTKGTDFQEKIWKALRRIPRAIGAANARNPVAIIIPCHRVTGAGNKIKGFAGGSAAVRGLLAIERRQPRGKAGSKESHEH